MEIKIYSDILRMKQENFHSLKKRIVNKYGIKEKTHFIFATFNSQNIFYYEIFYYEFKS